MNLNKDVAEALLDIRKVGESMFAELVHDLGCGHTDPRHPDQDHCPYCRAKARQMDLWDEALVRNALAVRKARHET